MNNQVLSVRVGQDAISPLSRMADTMNALDRGDTPVSHFEIGFKNVADMFAVFTPRRWELLAALRKSGPMSIASLARLLKRDYKNVHGDVAVLLGWLAVERDEAGLVRASFTDICVDVHLPDEPNVSKGERLAHA